MPRLALRGACLAPLECKIAPPPDALAPASLRCFLPLLLLLLLLFLLLQPTLAHHPFLHQPLFLHLSWPRQISHRVSVQHSMLEDLSLFPLLQDLCLLNIGDVCSVTNPPTNTPIISLDLLARYCANMSASSSSCPPSCPPPPPSPALSLSPCALSGEAEACGEVGIF